jgi:hypothetical protein
VIILKTIYCYDEKFKEQLIKEGFKLLSYQIIENKPCWLFDNTNNLKFTRSVDEKKIYF